MVCALMWRTYPIRPRAADSMESLTLGSLYRSSKKASMLSKCGVPTDKNK